MQITRVETILAHRYLLVRVHTDAGIVGLGESSAWGYLEASAQVVEKFARYLVGQDPRRIEHHWQYLYRAFYFRGAAIMGALSAIDIALWDIKGRALGVPVHELLGGPTRERVRVYLDVGGRTVDDVVAACVAAKERGFTAVGHVPPIVDGTKADPVYRTHAFRMRDAVEAVRRYREAVGDDVDLCIELHRQLKPAEAIELGRALEPFHIMFYEDPLKPDNLDAMAHVARQIGVPVATGERLHTVQEFAMLLARRGAEYVRPSLGLCGGFTGARKIAALAEAHEVEVSLHHVSSPVLTAANVQFAAAIPNFAIMEYQHNDDRPPKGDLVVEPIRYDGQGYLLVPDAPGIGCELAADAAERQPYSMRTIETRLHLDGSVVDM